MATKFNARLGVSVGSTPTDVIDANGSITANTLTVANNLTVSNTISVANSLTVNSSVMTYKGTILYHGANYTGTGGISLEMGQGRTANGYAFIDLVGDTTYTDYGLRLIRGNSGADTTSSLEHRGIGDLTIKTIDAGTLKLLTTNVPRLLIAPAGPITSNAALFVSPSNITNAYALASGITIKAPTGANTVDDVVFRVESTPGVAATSDRLIELVQASDATGLTSGVLRLGDAYTNANTPSKVQLHAAGNSYFTGGWLGVGTATPQRLLEAVFSNNSTTLTAAGSSYNRGIRVYNADTTIDSFAEIELRADSGDVKLASVSKGANLSDFVILNDQGTAALVEAFRITSGGNTGIGTASPNAKLQVVGTANVSGNVALGQDLTVAGNLTVSGTTTYINTTNLNVGDNIITLNADLSGATAPTENAGFEVNRGSSANVSFIWNETGQAFVAQAQSAAAGTNFAIRNDYGESNKDLSFWYQTAPTARIRVYGRPASPNAEQNMSFWVDDGTGGGASLVQRMTLTSNGNFGIGTVSPANRLHVRQDSTGNMGVIVQNRSSSGTPEAGVKFLTGAVDLTDARYAEIVSAGSTSTDLSFRTAAGASPTTKMYIAANGNVGVGVTTPVVPLDISGSASSGRSLQLRSGDISTQTDSAQILFTYNGAPWNASGYGHSIRTRHNAAQDVNNAIDFYLWNSSNTSGNASALGTYRIMTLDGSGRVGINNATPTDTLTVSGTLSTGNTTFVANNGNTIAVYMLDSDTLSFEGSSGQLFSISDSMTGSIYSVNDVSGIPSIEVFANGQVDVAQYGGNVDIGVSTSVVTVANTVTISNSTLLIANSTANSFVVNANGNVGIGTSSFTDRLTIEGNSTRFVQSGQGDAKIIHSGLVTSLRASSGVQLALGAGGSDAVRVTATGNVGINNTAPTNTLSINGSTYVGGTLVLNGGVNANGSLGTAGQVLTTNGTTTYWSTVVSGGGGFTNGQSISVSDLVATGNTTVNATFTVANATSTFVYVGANGNVGVGTSSPDTKLHVNGALKVLSIGTFATQYADVRLLHDGTSTANGYRWALDGSAPQNLYLQYTSDAFTSTATARMFVSGANGNIGIGNTAPTTKLSVNGTTYVGGNVTVEASQIAIAADDTNTKIQLTNRGNNTTARYPQFTAVHYSGNTTAGDTGGFPVVELIHNRGNSGSVLPIVSGDVLGGFNTWGSNTTTPTISATRIQGIAEANFTSTATAGLQFITTNAGTQTEKVRIAGNGNVGIANTTPAYKLQVSGTAGILGNTVITSNTSYATVGSRGALEVVSTGDYTGNTLVMSTKAGSSYALYFQPNSPAGSVVTWGLGQLNSSTDYPSTLYFDRGLVAIGVNNYTTTLNSNYKLLVNGATWIRQNNTGSSAAALYLGCFSDNADSPLFTISTDDATGDTMTMMSGRFNGAFQWKRGSSTGVKYIAELAGTTDSTTQFTLSHAADTAGDNTVKVKLSTGSDSYINSTSNVGIGTSSPNAKLQVVGTANVSGNVVVGGTLTVVDATVSGNLTVSGTTTYINTTNLNVGDNIITLNADVGGATAPTENAGIEINRGSSANATLLWDETLDGWVASNGNDANSKFVVTSNSIQRTTYMTASGIFEQWGTPASPGTYAEFVVAGGINKLDNRARDYYIANTTANNVIFAANGNVGIGNTTPVDKLSIAGKIQVNAGSSMAAVFQGKTTTYNINANTGTGSEIVSFVGSPYSSSSNAAIAITSMHSTGYAAMQHRSYLSSDAGGVYTVGHTIRTANSAGGSVVEYKYIDNIYGGSTTLYANNETRLTVSSLGHTYVSNGSVNTAMFAANGNVGFGTTAPAYDVDVNNDTSNTIIRINAGTSSAAQLRFDQAGALKTALTSLNGGSFALYHQGADRLTVAANGNVGIGNSTPAAPLVISGNTVINNAGSLTLTSGDIIFNDSDDSGASLIQKPAGNTSLAHRLDIANLGGPSDVNGFWNGLHLTSPPGIANSTSGAAYPRLSMFYTYSSNTAPSDLTFNMQAGNDSGLGTSIKLYSFATGGAATGIDIAANGNVGIGNTTPGSKLVVQGDTDVRGNLLLGGADAGPNYIAFHGTTGDNPNTYNHTYIGERIHTATEGSELLLFKGNDMNSDRVRLLGGELRFDTFTSYLAGTFEQVATSVNNVNRMLIAANGNVGIGTSTPTSQLHVQSSAYRSAAFVSAITASPASYDAGVAFQISAASAVSGVTFSGIDSRLLDIGVDPSNRVYLRAGNLNLVATGSTYMSVNGGSASHVFAANGNVGIGTTTPGYKLEVNGSFAATTKSFVIPHPTKEGMRLRYGSLEGPENGVYVRGRATTTTIELPDYWTALVDEESITVELTPIGKYQKLFVKEIKDNKVIIGNDAMFTNAVNCFYTVYGERKDVDKLIVES